MDRTQHSINLFSHYISRFIDWRPCWRFDRLNRLKWKSSLEDRERERERVNVSASHFECNEFRSLLIGKCYGNREICIPFPSEGGLFKHLRVTFASATPCAALHFKNSCRRDVAADRQVWVVRVYPRIYCLETFRNP